MAQINSLFHLIILFYFHLLNSDGDVYFSKYKTSFHPLNEMHKGWLFSV